MEYGIAGLSLIPCRSQPKDAAEQSNQLLFGEVYEILDNDKGWTLIRSFHDRYEAWIDENQVTPLSEEAHKALVSERPPRLAEPLAWVPDPQQDRSFPVLYGSAIHSDQVLDKCRKAGFSWTSPKEKVETAQPSMAPSTDHLIVYARNYLNAPYLWGGRSPFGIDCSGLIQMAFLFCGLTIARDASQQVKEGRTINLLEESQKGDLAFFRNQSGKVVHVGILLDQERILHASGRVRIDRIDHHGIYNGEKKRYTHTLHLIKRHNKFKEDHTVK